MIGVALKGLAGRKLRSLLTALAIVLGVAMISGTYVLTDTIKSGFNTIFDQSYKNTDAVITSKVAFKAAGTDMAEPPGFSDSVLSQVKRLPGIAAAEGSLEGEAKLVGRDGKVISTRGSSGIALSVDPDGDQRFNPLKLVAGDWPHGSGQIAIDKALADKKHYAVGDTIGVVSEGPVRQFQIAGIAKFASAGSIGGATLAIFDLPTTQDLLGKEGKLDTIRLAAKQGVSPAQLVREVRPVLPATAQVRTSEAQVQSESETAGTFIGYLQKFLLAFGFLALFVGAFVIANTLSITIAQRIREFATLRTLGASRRQVLRSVILEALVIGAVASLLGLFLGLGLAKGLNALFVALGIDLPHNGTVFATRTIVVSLAVGILITLIASLRPALRATKVPPIAAVREGAVLPRSRFARLGAVPAVTVLGAGIALLVFGVFGHGIDIAFRLVLLGGGVLTLFLGVAMNAPRTIKPLASVLGWPATRIGGSAGVLARENSMRNPSRTASTAAALMIGLALVTFVAVLGQGLRSSFESAVDSLFVGDYALTSQDGNSPFTKTADEAVARVPTVTAVSAVRGGEGRVFGKTTQITGVDANMAKTIEVDWYRGSDRVPAELGADGAFVEKKYAKKHHLALGSAVSVETPTGKTLHLRLKGIFKAPKGGSPFGDVTISTQEFDASYPSPKNIFTFVNTKGGASDANTALLQLSLKGFPDAKIATATEFKKNQEVGLNTILNLLYVLLGLSVIVSLFGIVNTLVLTVFERTRELGMLRAVGMTRRQVRRMIRHESIVTALIGAALGIVVGVFLAGLVTQALSGYGFVFAVPWSSLVVFAVAAVIAGIVAAILPARRASGLNVLEALQYE